MPEFRSREIVNAVRFDPENPPDGLKFDEDDGWFIENSLYFASVSPGDWVLLDKDNRATDTIPDAELQERYEPLAHIAATQSLLEACEAYDAAWTASCPEGPDGGAGRLSASTVQLWKQIRAAISAAK